MIGANSFVRFVPTLPDVVRYSETFNVPLPDLIRAVKKNQLEGIVAKRAGSQYRSGERSPDWVKWRANRGQQFFIGGYIPNGVALDSILVGYYEGRDLKYAANVRAGFSPEFRRVLLTHFEELQVARCPFVNLPDRGERRWGEGMTAAKMAVCRWLDPFIVARIEFLEWTPDNRLRHPRFVGIRSDKDAREVLHEHFDASRLTERDHTVSNEHRNTTRGRGSRTWIRLGRRYSEEESPVEQLDLVFRSRLRGDHHHGAKAVGEVWIACQI
jgi:ATP-dependent DNA ligase